MNYKITLVLVLISLVTTIIFTGCSRPVASKQDSESATATPDKTDKNKKTISCEDSFVPLASDENAAATARDVLIAASKAKSAPPLVEGQWLNSEPATLENLRGRVVLVDFWTFGCYNCRNTLPTLKRLDAEYRDKGLTIVGVHTPESEHEKKFANIEDAVKRLGIKYPVVTDGGGDTWRAYNIEAWPTVVILDKQGRIRYTHIGEGAYDVQEKVIRTLLAEKDNKTASESKGDGMMK